MASGRLSWAAAQRTLAGKQMCVYMYKKPLFTVGCIVFRALQKFSVAMGPFELTLKSNAFRKDTRFHVQVVK